MGAATRKPRHSRMRIAAKLVAERGMLQRDCTVLDISKTGARLAICSPQDAPDQFTIHLAPRGGPARQCRLVWRSAVEIGVVFDDSASQSAREPR